MQTTSRSRRLGSASPPGNRSTVPAPANLSATAPKMAEAISHVAEHWREGVDLEQLAASLHLSRFHFQRLFRSWAGVPPARFAQLFALNEAQQLLDRGRSVFDTALDVGLSGSSRLHDLFVTFEAVTPGEYRRRAAGLPVRWGLHPTPLGTVFVAATERGICHLEFVGDLTALQGAEDEVAAAALARLAHNWPDAELQRDDRGTEELCQPLISAEALPRALHVRGTNFQIQVWSALLHLPSGAATSYGGVAAAIRRPRAARAVGGAVGANPVAVFIPCHRVLRGTGAVGGYRWGEGRKRALLAREMACSEAAKEELRRAVDG